MAIFRVEKTKSYTVMSNHHLRNPRLSLKAKGLLSQILSLPDNWDYTLKGLAAINSEGVDAIRAAIRELEAEGYVTRSRCRNEKGQLAGTEYVIHEEPVTNTSDPEATTDTPMSEKPMLENPTLDNPMQEKPTLEKPTQVYPTQGNPTQLNKERANTEELNTYPYPDLMNAENQLAEYHAYEAVIKANIDYDALTASPEIDRQQLDELVALILGVLCSTSETIWISGNDYPTGLVRSRFMKLNIEHIRYVFFCMKNCTSDIRNIKQYLLATLFNAPATMGNYYAAKVNHDFFAQKQMA